MKSSHYLAIAVRLFSIVLFIYALRQSTMLIEVFTNGSINDIPVSIMFMLVTSIFPLVIAILLWYFPLSVSRSILKPDIDQPIEAMNAQSILTVLVLAIGLYVLYFAASDSIYWATLWHMSSQSNYSEAPLYLGGDNKANMVTTAVELAASIAIILKARTLSSRMLQVAK